MSDRPEDLAAAARQRTRDQVHAIFAERSEVPLRACPHCGARERTRYEQCPACGRSYFVAPPRFSRRTRRALAAVAATVALGAGAALVALFSGQAHDSAARQRAARAAAVAAERRRLAREQAPHHGRAIGMRRLRAGATPAEQRRARRRMVASLEAAITADARER